MSDAIKLALFAASPVYYQAPLYRLIADDPRLDFTAIFASDAGARRPLENDYGAPVEFGVDPLMGYRSEFLARASSNPSGGGVFALADFDVIRTIWSGKYDVVWLHGYHTVTHLLAALTQRIRGGAVIYREEQTGLSPRSTWKRAVKALGLRLLFHGVQGLYLGVHNRGWFERWGIPPARLHHAPYAVDNAALQEQARLLASRRAELRTTFGLPLEQEVILTLGRLVPKKQPLRVLEAFAELRLRKPCSLLVVGSGPLESAMRREVERRSIPDVVFAGFLDQTHVASAYVVADAFVLFSAYDETWGLVVNEALNFGLPVVLSDQVGCAPDLIGASGHGVILPHEASAPAVAAALERALEMERQVPAVLEQYTYERAARGVVSAVAAAVGVRRWSHVSLSAAVE